MRFAVLQLSGCAGCEVSLLNAGEDLTKNDVSLSYMPLLVSAHDVPPETDTLLVTGGIRNSEDLFKLREAARRVKRIVAVGTCAISGIRRMMYKLYMANKVFYLMLISSALHFFVSMLAKRIKHGGKPDAYAIEGIKEQAPCRPCSHIFSWTTFFRCQCCNGSRFRMCNMSSGQGNAQKDCCSS